MRLRSTTLVFLSINAIRGSARPHRAFMKASSRSSSTASLSPSDTTTTTPRILSIQSYTVHGYVGNKAAMFPLQCMGYNVDAINTAELSNHPVYTT